MLTYCHYILNDCSCYCLCVNVQASCADDKEQWVQLLQDGSSTTAGSPYQHTSHESLRYTHSHSHAVCLSVCCQHSTHSQKYSHSFRILFPFFCFLCSSVVWKAAGFPPQTCTWTTPFSSCVVHQSTRSPSIQTHPYWSTWYGPAGGGGDIINLLNNYHIIIMLWGILL